MFEGFALERVDVGEAELRVRHGGSGPPVLLLHGHPRTHVTWHEVAALLAPRFTVVCPDLRGYGESSKPATTPDHSPYSKRASDADGAADRRSTGPVLFLWASGEGLEDAYGDPLAIGRDWADDVGGQPIGCGHHMAGEAPGELARLLADFFAPALA